MTAAIEGTDLLVSGVSGAGFGELRVHDYLCGPADKKEEISSAKRGMKEKGMAWV